MLSPPQLPLSCQSCPGDPQTSHRAISLFTPSSNSPLGVHFLSLCLGLPACPVDPMVLPSICPTLWAGPGTGCPAAPQGGAVFRSECRKGCVWQPDQWGWRGWPVPTLCVPPTGGAAGHALGGRPQGRVQRGAHGCVLCAPPGRGWGEIPGVGQGLLLTQAGADVPVAVGAGALALCMSCRPPAPLLSLAISVITPPSAPFKHN